MAKEALKIGDKVWIEYRFNSWGIDEASTSIHEHEVVRANTTSAYAVKTEEVGSEKEKFKEIRIDQRSREVKDSLSNMINTYRYWNSKEEYEAHYRRQVETAAARQEVDKLVKSMNLEQLNEVILHFGKSK